MSDFLKDLESPEEVLAKQQDYEQKKRQAALLGGIADNLSNRQSFGSIMLGKNVGGFNPGASVEMAMAPGVSPQEAYKQRLSGLLQKAQLAKAGREDEEATAKLARSESDAAKLNPIYGAMAKQYGLASPDGLSSEGLKTYSDTLEKFAKLKQTSQDLAIKRDAANAAKLAKGDATFKGLSKEAQVQIDDIARANAAKMTIRNQLMSTLEKLKDPAIGASQKRALSEQSIKTLNSTEGKDAVGAEESKRLAAFLSWYPNTQKGMTLGPDLDAFAEQVYNTTAGINAAIENNNATMKNLYAGGSGVVDMSGLAPGAKKEKKELLNSANASSAGEDSLEFLKQHGKQYSMQPEEVELLKQLRGGKL